MMRRRHSFMLRLACFALVLLLSPPAVFALTPAEIYKKHADSVVTVYMEGFDGGGSGSGFFVGKGLVMTNAHNLMHQEVLVVRLRNGEILPLRRVIANDPYRDLALIEVDAPNAVPLQLAKKLPPIGEPVTVIGAPQDFSHSLTTGALSAVGRGERKNDIQVSAPISSGSSGSPIFDSKGQVIGIATRAWTRTVSQNLNFGCSSLGMLDFMEKKPLITERDYFMQQRVLNPKQYRTAAPNTYIYASGEFTRRDRLRLMRPIRSTMPGRNGVHFWFEIEPCTLEYVYHYNGNDYYAAPREAAWAYTSGAKRQVLAQGDRAGIYYEAKSRAKGWFVDNSKRYGTYTVWRRGFKDKEHALVRVEAEADIFYKSNATVCLVEYLGTTRNGEIELLFAEQLRGRETENDGIVLVIDPSEIPGVFYIMGGRLEIDSVRNGTLYYDWDTTPRL